MTHMLKGQLKGAMEETEKEKALKEVSEATLQDQAVELAAIERRSAEAERAHETTEKRVANLEGKLDDAEVRLAQAESLGKG